MQALPWAARAGVARCGAERGRKEDGLEVAGCQRETDRGWSGAVLAAVVQRVPTREGCSGAERSPGTGSQRSLGKVGLAGRVGQVVPGLGQG